MEFRHEQQQCRLCFTHLIIKLVNCLRNFIIVIPYSTRNNCTHTHRCRFATATTMRLYWFYFWLIIFAVAILRFFHPFMLCLSFITIVFMRRCIRPYYYHMVWYFLCNKVTAAMLMQSIWLNTRLLYMELNESFRFSATVRPILSQYKKKIHWKETTARTKW